MKFLSRKYWKTEARELLYSILIGILAISILSAGNLFLFIPFLISIHFGHEIETNALERGEGIRQRIYFYTSDLSRGEMVKKRFFRYFKLSIFTTFLCVGLFYLKGAGKFFSISWFIFNAFSLPLVYSVSVLYFDYRGWEKIRQYSYILIVPLNYLMKLPNALLIEKLDWISSFGLSKESGSLFLVSLLICLEVILFFILLWHTIFMEENREF